MAFSQVEYYDANEQGGHAALLKTTINVGLLLAMQDSPQVQAIRARYKASFNEKADMLNDFLSQIQAHVGDANSLTQLNAQLHEELHKLAGSLGMYGYDEFALLAREGMRNTKDNDVVALEANMHKLINNLLSSAASSES